MYVAKYFVVSAGLFPKNTKPALTEWRLTLFIIRYQLLTYFFYECFKHNYECLKLAHFLVFPLSTKQLNWIDLSFIIIRSQQRDVILLLNECDLGLLLTPPFSKLNSFFWKTRYRKLSLQRTYIIAHLKGFYNF